jgi:hypothetical protein
MRKGLIAFLIISTASVVSSLPSKAQMSNTPTANSTFKSAVPASDVYFLNRAKNLARQAAINANGGLGQYRPDPIMYGPAIQTAYARNSDGSITFRFNGSAPGISTPKFETVATVAANGVVSLDYNGTPRTAVGAASLPGSSSGMNAKVPISIAVPEPTQSSLPANPSPPNASTIPLSPAEGPLPGVITPTSTPRQGSPSSNPSTLAWIDQDAFVARAQNLARQAAIKANGGLAVYRPEPSMFGPSAKSPFVKNADGSLTFTFQGGTPGAPDLPLLSVVIVYPDGSVKIQYNGLKENAYSSGNNVER